MGKYQGDKVQAELSKDGIVRLIFDAARHREGRTFDAKVKGDLAALWAVCVAAKAPLHRGHFYLPGMSFDKGVKTISHAQASSYPAASFALSTTWPKTASGRSFPSHSLCVYTETQRELGDEGGRVLG